MRKVAGVVAWSSWSWLGLGLGAAGCRCRRAGRRAGLPLKKVVIYRNGVGYFERAGHVDSDRVEFRVRRNEVGDFLATLAVLERGGSSVRAAAFPMPPDSAPDAGAKLQTVVMSLDGSDHDLNVGYIAAAPIWRPSYRLVIDKDGAEPADLGHRAEPVGRRLEERLPVADRRGAAGVRRVAGTRGGAAAAADHRRRRDHRGGAAQRDVAGAGAAATAARGRARSRDGGAPTRPRMTTAGESVARGRLRWRAAGATLAPATARHGAAARRCPKAAAAPTISGRARNVAALAAVARAGGRHALRRRRHVTIPDGSATMVMLLDKRVPGEAICLFAPDPGVPDSATHPFRVARFTNRTGGLLERGPLAIFDRRRVPGTGDDRSAARRRDGDRAVRARAHAGGRADRETREEGARLYHIEAGVLTIAREQVLLAQYQLRNGADHDAKMLIKHPRISGARLVSPPPGTEDNVGTGSALVPATRRRARDDQARPSTSGSR